MMTTVNLSITSIVLSIGVSYLVYFILGKIPKISSAMNNDGLGKYIYLDSIRGIAATLVFIHHSIMIYNFYYTGQYGPNGAFSYESQSIRNIYTYFGQASVMIFFMITGFLFFGKLLNADNNFNIKKFYESRIRRLVPAALSGFVLLFIVALLLTKKESSLPFLKLLIGWLSFGFISLPNINNSIPGWVLNAGVFWTLAIEWKFYFLLPFMSYFIHGKKSAISFLIGSFVLITLLHKINQIDKHDVVVYSCFLFGLLAALITRINSALLNIILPKRITALAVIALLIIIFKKHDNAYNLSVAVAIFAFFLIVIFNNSIFGILKSKTLSYAGKGSYSIYILHAPILNLVCGIIIPGKSYYVSLVLSACLLGLISFLNYVCVERVFMKKNTLSSSEVDKKSNISVQLSDVKSIKQ
nr:MAG TPA: putative acyltransferase [Caudoviricetes sp.]